MPASDTVSPDLPTLSILLAFESVCLGSWNWLFRLIDACHVKYAIDCIAEVQSRLGTAPQMGGNQHIRSGAFAFGHNGVRPQFELKDSGVHAECRYAVEIDERRLLGTARCYLNGWTLQIKFLCHERLSSRGRNFESISAWRAGVRTTGAAAIGRSG